jgi:hypothetical protein
MDVQKELAVQSQTHPQALIFLAFLDSDADAVPVWRDGLRAKNVNVVVGSMMMLAGRYPPAISWIAAASDRPEFGSGFQQAVVSQLAAFGTSIEVERAVEAALANKPGLLTRYREKLEERRKDAEQRK